MQHSTNSFWYSRAETAKKPVYNDGIFQQDLYTLALATSLLLLCTHLKGVFQSASTLFKHMLEHFVYQFQVRTSFSKRSYRRSRFWKVALTSGSSPCPVSANSVGQELPFLQDLAVQAMPPFFLTTNGVWTVHSSGLTLSIYMSSLVWQGQLWRTQVQLLSLRCVSLACILSNFCFTQCHRVQVCGQHSLAVTIKAVPRSSLA